MVERTAHNGFVVGSNPAKPNYSQPKATLVLIKKMKFELKSYKLQKTKSYFKEKPLFFMFNVSNLNSKSWLKTEQVFFNYNLKYYKVYNTLSKKFLEKSIFKNTAVLMNGSICLVDFNKNEDIQINLQKIIKLNPSMPFLGLRLNTKVYSLSQLNTVSTINYNKTIKVFNKSLKKLLKLPYYKIGK